jgi:iron(III) transport system ATP-binding protein
LAALLISDLAKSHGSNEIISGLDLEVASGEILSILGPSGCGKTTLLRCVSGLEEPSRGSIMFGDRMVAAPGIWVPPEQRQIGMVFQSYALWPHLTVFQNVALGLRIKGINTQTVGRRVAEALKRLELEALPDRYPSQLSGGQQQRVAVARAIVLEPKLLLFDEPLSNLDARIRERVRGELHDLLRKLLITTLYVTHDKAEAMAISDRIAVMRDGRIEQVGTARQIYEMPATPFVADFIARYNLLPVRAPRSDDAIAPLQVGDHFVVVAGEGEQVVGTLGFRPEDGVLGAFVSGPNVLSATLVRQTYFGNTIEVVASVGGRQILLSVNRPIEGEAFQLQLPADNLVYFKGAEGTLHEVD